VDDIRNFCIIAHIDHGKSTLADRLIQRCGAVEDREFRDQILDSMDIERERGITIKSNTVTLLYDAQDGERYRLNLIDTPGHVDFSHEVRRSLMSCEGALLIVDASQGVEAQTVANLYLALEYDLDMIPVINKIDLPSADIERAREEISEDLGLDPYEAVLCSAKQGTGIDEILEAIVQRLPAPAGDPEAPLQALVFDAQYDPYRGVVMLCRVKEGTVHPGQTIRLMHTDKEYVVEEVGLLQLQRVETNRLEAGAVGYIIAGIKTVRDIAIGDTLTDDRRPAPEALPGFQEIKPMVFAGLYPVDSDQYGELRDALEKLRLNDSSFFSEPETSAALGFGFRCGFLGLLHMEIVEERLEREFDLDLLITAPSVRYRVLQTDGEVIEVDSPARLPGPGSIEAIEEPIITATILTGNFPVFGLTGCPGHGQTSGLVCVQVLQQFPVGCWHIILGDVVEREIRRYVANQGCCDLVPDSCFEVGGIEYIGYMVAVVPVIKLLLPGRILGVGANEHEGIAKHDSFTPPAVGLLVLFRANQEQDSPFFY